MNSATGIIREGTADQDASDRRRGIKLVARQKSGKAFRIRIADELLDPLDAHRGAQEQGKTYLNGAAMNRVQPGPEPGTSDESSVKPLAGNFTFVLAVTAAAGLIIGYLAGRRRD